MDTSVNVLRNSYNNLWRLLKRTLWFVNAFKCLHEYFTIHPFKMLIMNAHLKSSANLFFLSHLLNILKISKFINRNIEYIWLNCTISWETISVFNILYSCAMWNGRFKYKRTFEYAHWQHMNIKFAVWDETVLHFWRYVCKLVVVFIPFTFLRLLMLKNFFPLKSDLAWICVSINKSKLNCWNVEFHFLSIKKFVIE